MNRLIVLTAGCADNTMHPASALGSGPNACCPPAAVIAGTHASSWTLPASVHQQYIWDAMGSSCSYMASALVNSLRVGGQGGQEILKVWLRIFQTAAENKAPCLWAAQLCAVTSGCGNPDSFVLVGSWNEWGCRCQACDVADQKKKGKGIHLLPLIYQPGTDCTAALRAFAVLYQGS